MMGKYKAYKPSGVEWIGDIPEHWILVSTNKIFNNLGSGTTPKSENREYYDDGKFNWITTTDLNEGLLIDTLQKLTDKTIVDYPTLTFYPINSIFISMYGGKIGKIGVSTFQSYCNQSLCVLPTNPKCNMMFYYYWFLCFQEQLKSMGRGGGQPNINKDMIKEFPVCKLSFNEQIEIVQFLNEKTEIIDKLISTKERKIDLLKSQRTSLINQFITKGLNLDVKMKDSGVEWIGEIPEHWNMKKMKYIFEIRKRISGELGFDVLSVTQKGIKIKDIESGKGQVSMDYTKYQLVEIDDFIMNHMDLLTGYIDISKYVGVTSPDYRVFSKIDSSIDIKYYLYLFQFGYKNKVFYGFGQGSSMLGRWRLPSIEFNNFKLPYPSLHEQKQIVELIDKKTKEIEDLISLEQRKIDLLKEYRQAMISEVITGKIDVRNN